MKHLVNGLIVNLRVKELYAESVHLHITEQRKCKKHKMNMQKHTTRQLVS